MPPTMPHLETVSSMKYYFATHYPEVQPHIAAMARVKSYLTLLLLFLPEGELHLCSYEIHDRSVGLKCKLLSISELRFIMRCR